MSKLDETRLNVPMPRDMRDAVELRWRGMAECRGASDYIRKLIEKDLEHVGTDKAPAAGA